MLAKFKIIFLIFLTSSLNCKENKVIKIENVSNVKKGKEENTTKEVMTGASRTEAYFSLLKDKNVALAVNHTSLIGETHLADSLKTLGVNVVKIFAPEHGFRGDADAGEAIKNGVDTRTGIPIVSLYGKKKKTIKRRSAGYRNCCF